MEQEWAAVRNPPAWGGTASTLPAPELAGPATVGEHMPAWHYAHKHMVSCSSHTATARAGGPPHLTAFTPTPPVLPP